jgi:hypothetical protein
MYERYDDSFAFRVYRKLWFGDSWTSYRVAVAAAVVVVVVVVVVVDNYDAVVKNDASTILSRPAPRETPPILSKSTFAIHILNGTQKCVPMHMCKPYCFCAIFLWEDNSRHIDGNTPSSDTLSILYSPCRIESQRLIFGHCSLFSFGIYVELYRQYSHSIFFSVALCVLRSVTGDGRTGKGRTNQSNSVLEDGF